MSDGAEGFRGREETLEDREAGLRMCLAPFGGAGIPLNKVSTWLFLLQGDLEGGHIRFLKSKRPF